MAIVIKEIQVKISIDREHRPVEASEELVRRVKESVLEELRHARLQSSVITRGKER